jgi:hypothetical protein
MEEPYAGKLLVRVCGGAGRQRTALPGNLYYIAGSGRYSLSGIEHFPIYFYEFKTVIA